MHTSDNTELTWPDKATIHDVFTPAMLIGLINISDTTAHSQLLVVTTEGRRCYIAKKHDRVNATWQQTTRNTLFILIWTSKPSE